MAFPIVAEFVTSAHTATTTVHAVRLTSTTIASGDLLLVALGFDNPISSIWGTGFTLLYTVTTGAIGGLTQNVRYRIADGSEISTLSVTTTTGIESAHHIFRLNSWHGVTPPEVSTAVMVASTANNPPSLTPSWGSDDTLWISVCGVDGSRTISTFPDNYTTTDTFNTGGGPGTTLATARRNLAAASDDPTVFGWATAVNSISNTIAIRPAAGGPAAQMYFMNPPRMDGIGRGGIFPGNRVQ